MSLFYRFHLSDKKSIAYLSKEHISSIKQEGIGFGTEIKMTNGEVFKVGQTADQVLSILQEEVKQDKG
jgi:hypothetical protein